ncbi:2,4-dienoyl-CoA reductase-like NADH-dependent reductase (Old Yellow Enzyme family) [Pontibacter ummariensis]|uniref:2,4-dienoyl-CoA reductase n=1 Tax=Pontibacter ummariensis TaxID=1610492 RepID=A0A239EF32_9BACT|nr:NADH:flavin oxidoreductase [Pontibacter ummariensis]PRY13201.1 2,4-dienoyl-CoA reductase-like NADH-dependent reductase (Old Yellow Enzyme family) [Pontibacter ummariensis]SNS42623.1 2,4-dienoyl-CoA reductase [Pontibacter ummariensis]
MEEKTTPTNYPSLFSSFKIGHTTLKNRLGLAPMTRTSANPDGTANEQMLAYYRRYARGGFALILTEGVYPDESYSQGYLDQPGIANQAQIEAWQKIVDAVHQEGAKIFCQLMHAGALSQGNRFENYRIGPSSVQPKGQQLEFYGGKGPYPTPLEMAIEDIRNVTNNFVQAAKNAVAAGFDGIEIHGANGYLLDQFLTEYTNERTDEYGGSTRNRIRFAAEVVKATREALDPAIPVGIRISQSKVNDYTYKWSGGVEDARVVFATLAEAGADFIHTTEYEALKPAFGDTGLTLAALAKRFSQLPIVVNGSLNTPDLVELMLKEGGADIVTIGKGALANKDWPNRVAQGKELNQFKPEDFLAPNAKVKPHEL